MESKSVQGKFILTGKGIGKYGFQCDECKKEFFVGEYSSLNQPIICKACDVKLFGKIPIHSIHNTGRRIIRKANRFS